MRTTRRRLVLVAVPLVLLTGVGAWMYWQSWRLERWVPGRYSTERFGDPAPAVLRLRPDGSLLWDVYMFGTERPAIPVRGRWRLSGRVLVLEDGDAAAAPIGLLQPLTERFKRPSFLRDWSRSWVTSADESGLVLDLGDGITWTLTRTVGEP
jgi:hypothetical protein